MSFGHKLLLLAAVFIASSQAASNRPKNTTIEWRPCEQHGTEPVTCGTLSVPLDYTDSTSNQTLELSLVRVSATKQPNKGSILFNPGGPGEDGLSFINGPLASSLLASTGGHHDLIGFDPRGTGNTLPFTCYENDGDRMISLLRNPPTTNISDNALGMAWAQKQSLAQICYDNSRERGELLGTAFVARDMMQIVDALQEDGLLRYWGFSYGTALGATVAAMFPDRMDKVVLDGVLNPHQYYAGTDIEEVEDADATFREFLRGCLDAGPDACALAKDNVTVDVLEQSILDLLDDLKYNPFAAAPYNATTIIDYGLTKTAITIALYAPSLWPGLAAALDGLFDRNATALSAFMAGTISSANLRLIEINAAIRCGDNSISAKELKEILPVVDALYNTSYILGDVESSVTVTCAAWRIEAKERYQGGFHDIRTKNPLLMIGNTFDPLTPLASARNASAAFVDSVVLQQDGSGHSSLAQASRCTSEVVAAYFVNGTLPAPGTICKPDVPLFADGFANATTADVEKRDLDEGFAISLEAQKRLG